MPIKWENRGVVFAWVGGALLDVNWKNIEPVALGFSLGGPAREVQQLKKLPAILIAITIIGHHWIEKIELRRVSASILRVGEQRRYCPGVLGLPLLLIIERAQGFQPFARSKRQRKLIEKRTRIRKIRGRALGC